MRCKTINLEKDILGKALMDFHNGDYTTDIITYSSLEEEDVLPIPYLFRDYEQMPSLEKKALELCKGSVLDIGCGAGNHSLYLQKKGIIVSCMDQSQGAITVCKSRGIKNVRQSTLLNFDQGRFDTLLLLMNGIGISGRLKHIDMFLNKLKSLLNEGGQILLDSSDIIYMFEGDEDNGYWIPEDVAYYGEVSFTMKYKNQESDEFPWLYLDFNTLKRAATCNGLTCELLFEGEHFDYLARLRLKT
ncbi:MAG: SAM-dependent methyltransferase [Maribacter sp.]